MFLPQNSSLDQVSGMIGGGLLSDGQVWVLISLFVCVSVVLLGLHIWDRVRKGRFESAKEWRELEHDMGTKEWNERVRREGGGGKGGQKGV